MRIPRFLCAVASPTSEILLDPDESNHLLRSLRLEPGAEVEVCDIDAKKVWFAEFTGEKNGRAAVRPKSERTPRELFPVTLAMAMVSSAAADAVVEKAVELGIRGLYFFSAERSQERLRGEASKKRLERFARVARSALKQCGATALPEIGVLGGFEEAARISGASAGLKLFCAGPDQDGQDSEITHLLSAVLEGDENLHWRLERIPQNADFLVMIGPEGGWSTAELARAKEAGFLPVSLGPNTLRAETAAVAAMSLLTAVAGRK